MEVLVAMAVGLLVVVAAQRLFLVANHALVHVQAASEVQASGLTAVAMLSRELRTSSWSTITVSGTAISFMEPDPTAVVPLKFTGNHVMSVYYLTGQAFMRKTVAWPTPGRMGATALTAAVTTPNGTERKLADNVTLVQWTPAAYPPDPPQAVNSLSLTLHVLKHTNSVEYVDETLTTAITVRNP